jgi:uncharacterized protein YneR
MPIQDNDLFLIESGGSGPVMNGVSFKITAQKLKENLAPNTYYNYKLLVNKPDYSSRYVLTQNMQQSVAPTDYMMVERSGVSYKVTGQQIIDYFPSVPAGQTDQINSSEVAMNMPFTKEQVFELGSAANLDNFVVGDSMVMVDENGDVVTHINETSTITNVVAITRNWLGAISSSNGYYPGRDPQYAFNGNPNNSVNTNQGGTLTWNPGTGGPTGDCIRGKFTGSFKVFVNDGNGNAVEKYTVGAGTGNFVMSETFFDKKEQVMKLVGTNGGETCGWFYFNVGPFQMVLGPGNINVEAICENNNDLRSFQFLQHTQSREGQDVLVIGVDVEANKIILDGGRYIGTDGSSVDTPLIQSGVVAQTKVTIKGGGITAISGTANYKSHIGSELTVSNSNAQFVMQPNSSGVSYFIKDSSSRIGLAILRTKAIEAATQIAQAKEDIDDGEFAIVDNNYWFKDEDALIDLGPVNLPSK